MTRLFSILILLAGLGLAACDNHTHDEHGGHGAHGDHGGHGHGAGEGPVEVITHFNDHTELFVEFPTLAMGEESPFEAHLTWLSNYRPVATGKVSVILQGGGQPEEVFVIEQPSIPGIFRPVVIPKHDGQRELILKLETVDKNSVHNLGSFAVNLDRGEAEEEAGDDGSIRFLKEQQWQVDFALAPIEQRQLRESIPAMATIRAPADREVMLSAPHDGQLGKRAGQKFPVVGDTVRKGQVLAVVGSRLGRELSDGISGSALRAPIHGTVAQMLAIPGTYLKQGDPILHIVDNASLWLDVQIPEVDVSHIKQVSGAWILLPGRDKPLRIETGGDKPNGKLVAFGKVVDPVSRTAPLVLSFDNPDQLLRIGTYAEARVFTGHEAAGPAIPVTALVNDNGVDVVYVMKHGEAFERRPVQLGIRDGEYVQALSGVKPGEWVVSRGAYLVKLAASGSGEIGHGHAH